jgi:hypothetical protein
LANDGKIMDHLQIERARYWLQVARVAAIWTFVLIGGAALIFR